MSYGNVVERGGAFSRLADPAWTDPLDTAFSKTTGGRWNAPGSHGVLYLNNGEPTARAQVAHKLSGQPFAVEDLDPDQLHDLVDVFVAPAQVLDCVSDDGLAAVGLPLSYPKRATGEPVRHGDCHPIGAASLADGQDGIACRSAAEGTSSADEELALFEAATKARVTITARRPFKDWYLDR